MTTPSLPPKDTLWYRDAIFYELRVRSFYDANGDGLGDFQGLTEKLDYLQDLGVTALWLLPFYPSPLRDDGYDIADYLDVHPDMGTLADFKDFLKQAHRRGLRVVTELVLNHTSDQHAWFQRARRAKPGSTERNYYVWSDTPAKFPAARIIFKDFERSNWAWDPVANAYYWHRFFSHQPDLNFDNPAVRRAILKVVDFWFELGVDGLRLDAVPYLFEREGTNCENLPETLSYLEELRRHVDRNFKGRMLLAEANQWPEDAVRYLDGGNKCHMAFHFPIMPRMFMALHMEDRFPITETLAQTPPLPDTCQWAMFLRNHDELTLEMVTDEERDYMYEAYGKDPSSRINLGIRRRLAPLLENNRRKLELLNVLLFSMPGTPIIYYGDEIGMGDNIHLGDRNGVRTPMQWSADRNAGFSRVNPQQLYLPVIVDPEYHFESVNVEAQQANLSSLLWWTKRLIALRKQYRVFGRGTCEFLDPGNHKVLAFVREFDDERILVVANLSRFAQYVELDLSRYQDLVPVEVFGRTPFPPIKDRPFVLTPGPHTTFWFSLERPKGSVAAVDTQAAIPELEVSGSWPGWLADAPPKGLEPALAGFLGRSRWFGGKGRSIKGVRVAASFPVPAGARAAVLLVLDVSYADGGGESYHVPLAFAEGPHADALLADAPAAVVAKLRTRGGNGNATSGILVDAFRLPVFCSALLQIIERRRPTRNGSAEIKPCIVPWLRRAPAFHTADLPPRLLGAEQSNTSVVFGDRFILKTFRRSAPGRNPDVEVGRFLTEKSRFANTPRVAAWLEYRTGREPPRILAALHEYAPGTRDAWEFARDEIKRFFDRVLVLAKDAATPSTEGSLLDLIPTEPPAAIRQVLGSGPTWAELLGRRTAEMHIALSGDSENDDFAPEPYGALYQRAIYQSMRNLAQKVLRQLRRSLPDLAAEIRDAASEVLAQDRTILSCFEEFRHLNVQEVKMRHHGDFHLGQVLFTGKDFLIIDFEGEPARLLPERLRKRSVLRDVAGMLRSFHYAVVSTLIKHSDAKVLAEADRKRLEAWAEIWYRYMARAFMKAYFETAGSAPFVPKDPRERRIMLNVFLMEKALYEISYELNNRPTWLRIPFRGIRDILADSKQTG
jgi:maltose alpha-D-glucosyltransferase / alpha-amylase